MLNVLRYAILSGRKMPYSVFTGENSLIDSISKMLLATGSIIVFISLLGYLGSIRRIRSLVIVYMVLVVLVFAAQIGMLTQLYIGSEMVNKLWKAEIDELILTYGNKNLSEQYPQWDILNGIQRTLQCCGRYNFTDWNKNEYKEHVNQVPCSCTASNMKEWFCDVLKNATYTKGCEEDIKAWYDENSWILFLIHFGLLAIEVLQFIIATCLSSIMRKNVVLPKM
ncbi:tetraspanin-19 isoform X2 [Paroedura picta]|uniref:tetraspanin-19 isoform X2 n=1 Tax=Paroedura picta TaxID=143630 RepID=UPI0040573463